jgi:short-subunit dehydrogenase
MYVQSTEPNCSQQRTQYADSSNGAQRVAVVTGASSGLGAALAKELAARGWRVGLIARRSELLAQTKQEIVDGGGAAETFTADVTDNAQVVTAIESFTDSLGPIELAIACAGFAPPETVRPIATGDIRQMIEVNYLGVVHTLAAALPGMLDRGHGHLAAVSSLAAYKGLPSMCGYSASKAAVNTFLEGLRLELRGSGVAVTTLCPGFIETPMTAHNAGSMPLLMTAPDAAQRILRALEQKRSVLAFPWPLAMATQLSAFAPDWLVDRLAPREVPT